MSSTLITVLGTLFGIIITALVSLGVARMSHNATKEGSALDGFDKLSTRIQSRLETVENRIGEAETRAQTAEETANQLKGRVTELEKQEAKHIKTIQRLRDYVTYLTEQMALHAPEVKINPLEDQEL